MSVHAVLVRKAVEMQGLVHQTQLRKAEVSSFCAGCSRFGEYRQHETNFLSPLSVSGCLTTSCSPPRRSWGPVCCFGWLARECVQPLLLTAFQPGAMLKTVLGWVSCTPPIGAFLLRQSRAAFCPGCWHRSLEDAGH